MTWIVYAAISALAAAATAALAKVGVEGIPSTLATAVRTVVVLVFAWLMVFQAGEFRVITLCRFATLGTRTDSVSALLHFS